MNGFEKILLIGFPIALCVGGGLLLILGANRHHEDHPKDLNPVDAKESESLKKTNVPEQKEAEAKAAQE